MNHDAMNSPKRSALFVLLTADVLVVVIGLLWAREPVYRGKPLSAWLEELGEDTPEKRMPAVEAIRHFGTDATPAVIRLLRYQESPLKRKVRELAAKQNLVKFRFEDSRRRRRRALIACDALGPAAAPVIPTLVNLLTNEQPPEPDIPYLLARIGPPAVPALNCALTNDEKFIRWGAKYCLHLLRTNAPFLHPENRPTEDQDFLLRTCEYHVVIMQAAVREYSAQRGRNLMGMPPPSLPEDFDPKTFDPILKQHPNQGQQTNSPNRFE